MLCPHPTKPHIEVVEPPRREFEDKKRSVTTSQQSNLLDTAAMQSQIMDRRIQLWLCRSMIQHRQAMKSPAMIVIIRCSTSAFSTA
jgi:hypothetical protein